jgi:succinyl-diaminopimelate desuccinylase
MDCRILPSIDTDEVLKKIGELVDAVSSRHGVTIDCSVVTEQRSLPTPKDAPIVSSLGSAIKSVYGVETELVGVGGGTVAAPLRNEGYHTVVWSRIDATAHMPNEYCLISNLVGDSKVMAHMMYAG